MKLRKEKISPERLKEIKISNGRLAREALYQFMMRTDRMARIIKEDTDEDKIAKFTIALLEATTDSERVVARYRIKELRGKLDENEN